MDRREAETGCFLMLTNVPAEGEDACSGEAILCACKDQHGVERNFSFLKEPLIVNDLFLKKPERIEVLGMVLLIVLLIWNLMERNMRLLEGVDGNLAEGHTLETMLTGLNAPDGALVVMDRGVATEKNLAWLRAGLSLSGSQSRARLPLRSGAGHHLG
jgi:hypothetical protein